MGVFAKTSPFELRADRHLCASQCTSNECFTGTKDHEGCPFGQMVPTLRSNRFCKMCGACVKNCPHGAVNLNLRVPGREIWEIRQISAVTAVIVISMLGGLLSEMGHKMAIYQQWTWLFPFESHLLLFSLFFLILLALSNAVVLLAATISAPASGESIKENFSRYGLALLPLVLTGYMAFHLYYLINLGVYFPIMLWETFKFEIFRTLVVTIPPAWTQVMQQSLILLGVIGSLVIAFRLSRGRHTSLRSSFIEYVPHGMATIIFFAALSYAIREFFS